MTANQAHTPTTEVIRETYIGEPPYTLYGYTEEEFDRWYNAKIAAAEQRGAVKALQDLADNHTVRIPDVLGYKVQAVFTETIWEKLDEMNRADQEGDDE